MNVYDASDDAYIVFFTFLADLSHLSIASVQRRIKRLKENGVIERQTYQLNPKALDMRMSFVVMIEMEREQADQLEKFQKLASQDPNVQQCYYVTGEADFVLICLAQDMEEFEEITKRLFFNNSNVRGFTTNVVMSRSKVTLDVPVR